MKTLSFVIPVYNEENRIEKTIKALKKSFSFDGIKLEQIIFVNDGSTDNTLKLINSQKKEIESASKSQLIILSYKHNKGKGYAVKQGMLKSKSDYTLLFDADISTPINEFMKFIPYINKDIDVVIGTRKNGKSTVLKHQPRYRELLGKGFTLLSNVILNTWVTDFTCGFKAFSKKAKDEIFPKSIIDRWGYDAEIIFLARKLNYSIREQAVTWKNDDHTKVNLLKDLPKTFYDLFKIRTYHSNLGIYPYRNLNWRQA